ncbi:PilN domain-containing protein [Anabaena cylindrica FACHB-243]|uniref:Fimbrial assembly family protein n=1 Tax=Anabaena cylindrica (strain ATCC 27899 / PCC 7122) TaxID=272123 RepID=K9ZFL9_ANACC|nr:MULTISPECIES: PilN domain-containing protein [Anabaena]AFZ57539.1 Fimbrial assembly family protein [Anabaena cylindrica PCC 7122]MBD2418476.1 PilN domain-containing protein [Anabaena cylindrica FACHB-243]MBY5283687.1 PilN domain-containing protein [Anabaena sp. CCAP 1446/1C]MBY5308463.1 PilN domain-containing protein [Anabaena sp. CCAP 1446/1C]MCM2405096.1 PilN domain-containing protein [Anabaena sp. CCAP 1446/1C]
MYSLDINFLKDRSPVEINTEKPVRQPINLGDLMPVYLGVGVGLCFPALVFGGLLFLQAKTDELTQAIQKLDQENKELDGRIANIKKVQDETTNIKVQTQALVTVFDQIRPWSAMLQDLRDRIPANVQIENIKQTPGIIQAQDKTPSNPAGSLEITGFARSFNDVNDFVLSLGQSKFLDASNSKISTAELINAPSQTGAIQPEGQGQEKIKPIQVVKYTIKAGLSNVPASELIRELEQKGTVGLVTRLRSIQKTGAITK